MSDQNEFPATHHLPAVDVVTAAYSEVTNHNRSKTGLGAALFGIIETLLPPEAITLDEDEGKLLHIEEEPTNQATNVEQGSTKRVVEGDMEGEVVELLHSDMFLRIGVRMAPLGSYWGFGGESGRITSVELQPVLENSTLFHDFLESVPTDHSETANLHPLVNGVLGTIGKQVRLGFDPAAVQGQELPVSPDELRSLGEDGLRKFVEIEEELERLGLDNSYPAEALKEAVKYWGDGILAEFYVADATGVMQGVNSKTFSPSEWQRDASREFLEGRWEAIVEAIKFAKANPKAKKFAEELIDRAMAHLEFARKDFVEVDSQYNGSDSDYRYGEGFVEVFDSVDLQLRELAEAE